ncbi:DUF4249 domain-containing protein [Bernardetia sp. ABR2-2B]|uniref:DUF4249 domain-containing protein n=1 Tax=Bernardetia sp. ABR2-2B TaxID=3127472 RepID=UPI0030D5EF5B
MKNTIKFILFISVSLLVLSSCGKFLEDVDVEGDDQVVVVGFISPDDSLIQITLFRAVGIGKERETDGINYIQNATVRISDGQSSYNMSYGANPYYSQDLGNGYYNYYSGQPEYTFQLENAILNVSEGKTYFLEIETDEGAKLNASCIVPTGRVLPKVELTKLNEQEYKYSAEWEDEDDLTKTNYYRIEAYTTSFSTNYNSNTGEPIGVTKHTRPTYFYENYFKTQEGRSIINYNPQEKIYFDDYSIPNFPDSPTPNPYLTTYLMKADENYYRYHKTVEDSYYNGDNPFGEPIIIHSNIENGIGCFGAYITGEVITEVE